MEYGKEILKYLPLTESTIYTLLALVEPIHGYGLMQRVEEVSKGTVKIGPGTLYGAFSTLEKEGLIQMVNEVERRKVYALTAKGRKVLAAQIDRLEIMAENAKNIRNQILE